jgi:hypothetical protein
LDGAFAASSWGPSDDGWPKPDVVAPAFAASVLGEFAGTSVAAAFAAGFAALVKQVEPAASGRALGELLRQVAARIGKDVPNNQFGFGMIRADGLAKVGAGPGAPGGNVRVPPEWGGAISEAALGAALRSGLTAEGPDVRIVTGSDIYRRGDGMLAGVWSPAGRSCLLIVRDSLGRLRALSPEWAAVSVKAGVERVVPESSVLPVAGPAGLYDLIAFCAGRPFPIGAGSSAPQAVTASLYRYEVR